MYTNINTEIYITLSSYIFINFMQFDTNYTFMNSSCKYGLVTIIFFDTINIINMSMFLIFNVVTVVEASAPLPPPGYILTYD